LFYIYEAKGDEKVLSRRW